jgi:hypothetical protein
LALAHVEDMLVWNFLIRETEDVTTGASSPVGLFGTGLACTISLPPKQGIHCASWRLSFVDEFTGRMMLAESGQTSLHQAVEAKEVSIVQAGRTSPMHHHDPELFPHV